MNFITYQVHEFWGLDWGGEVWTRTLLCEILYITIKHKNSGMCGICVCVCNE